MDTRAKIAFGLGMALFLAFCGAMVGGSITVVLLVLLFICALGVEIAGATLDGNGYAMLFQHLFNHWWVPAAACAGIAVVLGVLFSEFDRAIGMMDNPGPEKNDE